MALNATSMMQKIKAHMAAVGAYQGSGGPDTLAYRDLQLTAMCQGIIDEIVENAVVTTTSGAPDGEHTGEID